MYQLPNRLNFSTFQSSQCILKLRSLPPLNAIIAKIHAKLLRTISSENELFLFFCNPKYLQFYAWLSHKSIKQLHTIHYQPIYLHYIARLQPFQYLTCKRFSKFLLLKDVLKFHKFSLLSKVNWHVVYLFPEFCQNNLKILQITFFQKAFNLLDNMLKLAIHVFSSHSNDLVLKLSLKL
jgi:hypothetical protein